MPLSKEAQDRLSQAVSRSSILASKFDGVFAGLVGDPIHKAAYIRYLNAVKVDTLPWSGWEGIVGSLIPYGEYESRLAQLSSIAIQPSGAVSMALDREADQLGFVNHRAVRRYIRKDDPPPMMLPLPDGIVQARQEMIERDKGMEDVRKWALGEPGDPRAAHYIDYLSKLGGSVDMAMRPREWWRCIRDVATTDAITPQFQKACDLFARQIGAPDQATTVAWLVEFRNWSGGKDE